jgi:hypothetical protein
MLNAFDAFDKFVMRFILTKGWIGEFVIASIVMEVLIMVASEDCRFVDSLTVNC